MHIELADDLVGRIDEVAGPRGRSDFVRRAVDRALADEERWGRLERMAGVFAHTDHDWDDDPAEWIRRQRRGDVRRGG
jgi:metal-responsive CopG/Arc/MetJ family transcriptional regulator